MYWRITLLKNLRKYKEKFTEYGAIGTLMSGSGNAVFGIFDNLNMAESAKEKFKKFTNLVYLV